MLFQFPLEKNDAKWQTKKNISQFIFFLLFSSFRNEKHLFLPLHMQCFFHQINYFSKHSYSSLTLKRKQKKSNKNEMNEHLFVWCLSTKNSFPYSYVESRENLQLCRKKGRRWAGIISERTSFNSCLFSDSILAEKIFFVMKTFSQFSSLF